jgi:hypothetical protein
MIVERGEATTKELSAEVGSWPEVVAKWLRPLNCSSRSMTAPAAPNGPTTAR